MEGSRTSVCAADVAAAAESIAPTVAGRELIGP